MANIFIQSEGALLIITRTMDEFRFRSINEDGTITSWDKGTNVQVSFHAMKLLHAMGFHEACKHTHRTHTDPLPNDPPGDITHDS